MNQATWTGTAAGVYRDDFFKISNANYSGDSGGPVGVEYIFNGNNCFTIYGITVALEGVTEGGPTLACKVNNILSQLGVSVVTGPGYPY